MARSTNFGRTSPVRCITQPTRDLDGGATVGDAEPTGTPLVGPGPGLLVVVLADTVGDSDEDIGRTAVTGGTVIVAASRSRTCVRSDDFQYLVLVSVTTNAAVRASLGDCSLPPGSVPWTSALPEENPSPAAVRWGR
jgi:hypothetical protein